MPEKNKLKRTLGIWDILMFGVGGIVGAGIYAIVGEAAGLAGNLLWLSFGFAAFVALLTGLAYAEFVSQFPDAGGSFEFVKRGFGETAALWMSILMLFTGVIAPAAIAISFSDYFGRLFDMPNWIATVAIILLMGGVNLVGAQHASWFNMGATIITLAGLVVVIGFAIPSWGSTPLLEWPEQGIQGILAGSALIFFSYVGFEDVVKMAEETREPERVMPKGILISGAIVFVLYMLIAVSCVSVLPADELANSQGPLAQVLGTVAGSAWVTGLIIVALFATSKTVLSNIMGTSRLLYDVARDSEIVWLKSLTRVNAKTNTPVYAIVAISAIVILFSLIGDLKIVASLSNIFVFLLFLAINAALLTYRWTVREAQEAAFRIPWNVGRVPIPTVLAILGLLVLLAFNMYNLF